MIGITKPMKEKDFLLYVKEKCCGGIRHSNLQENQKWLFYGAGSFAIKTLFKQTDAYLTADLKYHQFYEAENAISDIGHFESERYTKLYC
jgi:putative NIF3 family GTP cyclohydrolase 1 type 2